MAYINDMKTWRPTIISEDAWAKLLKTMSAEEACRCATELYITELEKSKCDS